jgi:hypothetical protein
MMTSSDIENMSLIMEEELVNFMTVLREEQAQSLDCEGDGIPRDTELRSYE